MTRMCSLCEGWGERYITVVEYTRKVRCVGCFGKGTVPETARWRPYEPVLPSCDDCGRPDGDGHAADCFYHGPY